MKTVWGEEGGGRGGPRRPIAISTWIWQGCPLPVPIFIYSSQADNTPHHRVGRVLSFFSSRRNWEYPSPAGECAPPPPGSEWRGTLEREGLGESQFRRGDIHCGTLFIYTYFVLRLLWAEMYLLPSCLSLSLMREYVYRIGRGQAFCLL
jgi:hypothetical protein